MIREIKASSVFLQLEMRGTKPATSLRKPALATGPVCPNGYVGTGTAGQANIWHSGIYMEMNLSGQAHRIRRAPTLPSRGPTRVSKPTPRRQSRSSNKLRSGPIATEEPASSSSLGSYRYLSFPCCSTLFGNLHDDLSVQQDPAAFSKVRRCTHRCSLSGG